MNDYPPIRCYDDLIDAMRARVAELGITMQTLDELSGLQPGYSAKLLGPARIKTLGPMSFDALLGALALELVPQSDINAAQKMEARWEARERPIPSVGKRLSMAAERRFTPLIAREMGRRGGKKSAEIRMTEWPQEKRRRIAKKAAKARWRKLSRR